MSKEKKNYVQNSVLGKVLRTIGFAAVLFSAMFYLAFYLGVLNLGGEFPGKIIDFYLNTIKLNFVWTSVIFYGGMLLLTWCLSKNYVLRILTTVFIVVAVTFGSSGICYLANAPEFLVDIRTKMFDMWGLFGTVVYLPANLLLAILLLKKKPISLPAIFIGIGMAISVVCILLGVIDFYVDFADFAETFNKIGYYLALTTYGTASIGSLLGIIFCYKK